MLRDLGDKVDAAKKTEIEDEIKKVKDALAKDDAAEIKTAVESLNAKVGSVSEELYKQAAAAAQAQGAPGTQTPPPEGGTAPSGEKKDDVVDAEFETVDPDKK